MSLWYHIILYCMKLIIAYYVYYFLLLLLCLITMPCTISYLGLCIIQPAILIVRHFCRQASQRAVKVEYTPGCTQHRRLFRPKKVEQFASQRTSEDWGNPEKGLHLPQKWGNETYLLKVFFGLMLLMLLIHRKPWTQVPKKQQDTQGCPSLIFGDPIYVWILTMVVFDKFKIW